MAHSDESPGMTADEFVEWVAAQTTDEDMDGDMSGDDAVSTLADIVMTARAMRKDRMKEAA